MLGMTAGHGTQRPKTHAVCPTCLLCWTIGSNSARTGAAEPATTHTMRSHNARPHVYCRFQAYASMLSRQALS